MTTLLRIVWSLSFVLPLASFSMAQVGAFAFPPVSTLNQNSLPDHAAPGSPDTQIVVNGTDLAGYYDHGSKPYQAQLLWNGIGLDTSIVGNQLVATIPASLLVKAGTARIITDNSLDSNTLFFTVSASTRSLSPSWKRGDYVVGGQTERQVVADLNGDGIMDIVSVDTQNNAIRVLLGKGHGTFQNAVSYATGKGPSGLAVGPFEGIDSQDIAVANYIDGTVSILLNNGNGTYQNRVDYPVGRGPVALVVGNFENAEYDDLAVVNSLDNTMTILQNNSGAGFTTLQTNPTGPDPVAIALGDFDRDGNLDLAVTNFGSYTGNTLSIFYGTGGYFSPKVDLTTDKGPQSVIAADVNHDGILDLVTANACGHAATCGRPGTVSVFLGNGNRTFRNAVNYAAGSYPFAVVAADFRGQNILDLAVTDLDSGYIDILYGYGNGTFVPGVFIPTNSRPTGLAVGDFNNDGKLDLVVGGTSPAQVTIMTQ